MTNKIDGTVLLCILDGWGLSSKIKDNAIAEANTPNWDRMITQYPFAKANASGLAVGLPEGQMGNSEVGHINIGAGRLVLQDLPRINKTVADDTFTDLENFNKLVKTAKDNTGVCHIAGLLSPGGVHSQQAHIVALVKALSKEGIKVKVHAFLDGRDTAPTSGKGFVESFVNDIKGHGELSTITGRFYAMDRDTRWDRVEQAYNALISAKGIKYTNAVDAVQSSYDDGKNDEFVEAHVLEGYTGFQENDCFLFANFRSDRARELSTAIVDPAFDGFKREKQVKLSYQGSMTKYSDKLAEFMDVLFAPSRLENTLGDVISKAGKKQLRIAETEKYPHVTFFFNGGEESVYDGEERILIASPKVATYDLQPEMSAPEVCDKLVDAIESKKFDVIIVNFANGDMVGHTGIIEAAKKACETVDNCLGRLEASIKNVSGSMIVTADHGNAEKMVDEKTGEPFTAHTTSFVPVVLVNGPQSAKLNDGALCDLAPTILELAGLDQPSEMTGKSLIK